MTTSSPIEQVTPQEQPQRPFILQRYLLLFIVLTLAITLVGFLRGIKEPPPLSAYSPTTDPAQSDHQYPAAVKYADMAESRQQAFASQNSYLKDLKSPTPGPFDPVIHTEETKLLALLDRSKVRAYDSAPPVIPHGIDQMKTSHCLACHEQGILVGDRIATKVSHAHFTNCTQCHVEQDRKQTPWTTTVLAENNFSGTGRAGPGTRAWPGAPPTIPHTTWMRQDCTSCHGLIARSGLRTTHPWLTNCTQCHAPSAQLDQVDFNKAETTRERP